MYNNENTKNTNAVSFVNIAGSISVFPPDKTVSVLTTLSFAINPVINAVEILQSEIPKGLKIGTNRFPKNASKLSAESCTRLSLASKFCKNHIAIVAIKIIVNALVIKSFDFMQISL
ncbi:unknown [Clostridium sp. CAG:967]|nr:unknown [Clostridium sp. CAG:967]